MRKLLKLFVGSFLIGQLASPILWANPGGVNWSTQYGGAWATPGGPGVTNQFFQTTSGNYSLDLTSAPVFPQATAPTSPTDGQTWNDSTRLSLTNFGNGMTGYIPKVIYSSTGSLTTATTSESTFTAKDTNFYGTTTLPANSLIAGKRVHFKIEGNMSSGWTTPGVIGFQVKIGTNVVSKSVGNQLPFLSSNTFVMEGVLISTQTGFFPMSNIISNFIVYVASGSTGFTGAYMVGVGTNTFGSVDTTVANVLNITSQTGTANNGNVVDVRSIIYYMEN